MGSWLRVIQRWNSFYWIWMRKESSEEEDLFWKVNIINYKEFFEFSKDLDETHLFVTADCDTWLKGRLADLMTENSFPIGEHV